MAKRNARNAAAKKAEQAKEAVVTAAEVVETKAEEVKAEDQVETVAEETVEEEVATEETVETVEAAVEEEEAVSEEQAETPVADKKKPGRKPGSKNKVVNPEKKEPAQAEVYVQYGPNGEASVADVVERIKNEYVAQGHRVSSIKSLKVYVKPEERSAYYVINEKTQGRVDLF